jgi:hypothetical protein
MAGRRQQWLLFSLSLASGPDGSRHDSRGSDKSGGSNFGVVAKVQTLATRNTVHMVIVD